MARKQHGDDGGGYSWMDTYGDLVTLLMCFFVMLFAMSSVNEEKWEMLVRSFTSRGNATQQLVLSPPDGEGNDIAVNTGSTDSDDEKVNIETLPENFDELFKYIKTYIEENQMQGSVSVEKGGDNSVYIRFQDNIFFQPDSANLVPESNGILDFIGNCIKAVEDEVLMTRVNGHTAAIPDIENYKISDRTLSTDRANSVVIYFEDTIGITSKKLMAQGYGKNFPVADNNTAEGRQKNRRVEMMILSNAVLAGSSDELNKIMQDTLSSDLFNDQMNTQGMLIPPTISTVEGTPGVKQEAEAGESKAPAGSNAATSNTGSAASTDTPPPSSGSTIPNTAPTVVAPPAPPT